jgi:hypothetical protein
VTSARKIQANRENARASTGPRTVAGKVKVASNARKHGLTISVLADPTRAAELDDLAREIAGADANLELQELASRIAAAQIDLVRVRRARQAMLSAVLDDPNYQPAADSKLNAKILTEVRKELGPEVPIPQWIMRVLRPKPEGVNKFAAVLADFGERMAVMERYERRALSRRKFAIRAFDIARAGAKLGLNRV